MDSIIQEVEKLSLETKGYQVEKENKAFEQIKDSVSTFQTFLQIFLYGIMIAGVGALILVLSLWLRERVYEVGILLALGKGKIAIFSQFCLEGHPSFIGIYFAGICSWKCHYFLSLEDCTSKR